MSARTAVLLSNLGTPDTLERASVKRFLREFLSDPLVVRLPRLLWLPLLHGIILPLRSGKTLQAYREIPASDAEATQSPPTDPGAEEGADASASAADAGHEPEKPTEEKS